MGKDDQVTEWSIKELGIGYPVIASEIRPLSTEWVDPNAPASVEGKAVTLKRFDFTLQFVWQPTPLSKRLETRAKAQQTPALAADGQGTNP